MSVQELFAATTSGPFESFGPGGVADVRCEDCGRTFRDWKACGGSIGCRWRGPAHAWDFGAEERGGQLVVRAISLWQPYASLVASGLKTIETRIWPTKIRGRVVICATQKSAPRSTFEEVFNRVVPLHGLAFAQAHWDLDGRPLPRGQALAIVSIAGCRPMEDADEDRALASKIDPATGKRRFAFDLASEVVRLKPFAVSGGQGWFRVPYDRLEAA